MAITENGQWSVDEWSDGQVVVQSSDFTHDVALKVAGDFRSYAQKIEYAQEIADRLNGVKADNVNAMGRPLKTGVPVRE